MTWFRLLLPGLAVAGCVAANTGAEPALRFRHHDLDRKLPGNFRGQTALADLDRDGKLDFITGQRNGPVHWYRFGAPDRWTRHLLGERSPSHVGGAALDVDRDGRVDFVAGGAWYRNPGNPLTAAFERIVFDAEWNSVHDLVLADFDGDLDIFTAEMEGIAGARPPRRYIRENVDGRGARFVERVILDAGLGSHEAVVADVDGDGDLDICGKLWRPRPDNANAGRNHADFLENRLIVTPPERP